MATETQPRRGPGAPTTEEILEGLNDLLQLNHDAIGAYNIAIEKLEDRDHASQIAGFRMDHGRHITALNERIVALGGAPRNEPHATGPLKEAMQSLGALAGDRGTLAAGRANELQVRTRYDTYASRANRWPAELKRLIDEQALDEERHYQWVADVLARMGVAEEEGAPLPERAMEQLGAATGAARERAAAGLQRAAGRLDDLAARGAGAGGVGARAAAAAQRLASGMESGAGYLREASLDVVRRDLEDQVRTSPVRTLLAVFAVGFVVGRALR